MFKETIESGSIKTVCPLELLSCSIPLISPLKSYFTGVTILPSLSVIILSWKAFDKDGSSKSSSNFLLIFIFKVFLWSLISLKSREASSFISFSGLIVLFITSSISLKLGIFPIVSLSCLYFPNSSSLVLKILTVLKFTFISQSSSTSR